MKGSPSTGHYWGVGKDRAEADSQRAERFAALFRSHYGRVLSYAARRIDDRAAAEDAAAETFTIAWRRYEELPSDPLPWLLGTARKVLANQRRAAKRRAAGPLVPLDQVEAPAAEAAVEERVADRSALASAFSALSERDREALALIAWDGLAVHEAAAVVGCTPARFSVRLHRARRRLMKELEAHGHSWGEEHHRVTRTGTAGV